MLSELSIENFAIIDRLRVQFPAGFTVLTGETGAGKSIIIDALQAALGARTGGDVVRGDARAASVEAVFDWPHSEAGEALAETLREAGIEDEECLILRRDINASGRTSSRINGRTVPSSVLQSIAALLVDIHGQSEHLSILRRDHQLQVLDRYGNLQSQAGEVSSAIREYSRLRREADALAGGQREAEQRLDLLRFQVGEIEAAQLQSREDEDLQAERNLLVNAERLSQLSGTVYESLQGEAGAAIEAIYQAQHAMRDLTAIDPAAASLHDRLESAAVELEDIAQEMRLYRDTVEFDPMRLEVIEERLDLLNRLKRKYGPTLQDVIDFGAQARSEMEAVENLDERIAALQAEVVAAERRAGELAWSLSQARRATAERLTDAMQVALRGLELRNTLFVAEVERASSKEGLPVPGDDARYAFTPNGIDTVNFLVSFNPGEVPRPLDKVASGGETSRFLLALKSVLAGADQTATLIFDEVDTGVGGRRGAVVGERMRDLSRQHQVICVSHLPQVAALADEHLTVTKSVVDGRTVVSVRPLSSSDRIAEIAEMLTGSESDASLQNARELLEAARQGR